MFIVIMTYFFLLFLIFPGYKIHLWVFSNCLRSPKTFSNIFIEKNSHVRGPVQFKHVLFKGQLWASLVAQWLRIHLPMQGTWVWSLVQEDPTCHGATGPLRHNCWACALGPASHHYWAHVPQLLKPMSLEPVLCNKRSHCSERPVHHNKE